MTTIKTNAVRPERKKLIRMAAEGRAKFRVWGSGKNWVVLVETPNRVVQVMGRVFVQMRKAQSHIAGKFGVTASQLKMKADRFPMEATAAA